MWNNLKGISTNLLKCAKWTYNTERTTFILRRTRGTKLNKMGCEHLKKLKRSSFYYELVEDTDTKRKPMLDLVLLKDVPGVGMLGEKIQANCYIGYRDLLLPKLAVYADSPEAQSIIRTKEEVQYSSKFSKIVENYLVSEALPIFLSATQEWVLEPWHVKLALRKKGILTNEECITLPQKKISGPNLEIENKDFIVKITMNKSEIFSLRCRIYHSISKQSDVASVNKLLSKSEPLFLEDKEEIDSLIKTEEDIRKRQKITGKIVQLKEVQK